LPARSAQFHCLGSVLLTASCLVIFSQEGVHVLDHLFFTVRTCFKLSEYINSQNSRIESAENPHALH
jgi:hypothetical protein